MEHVVELKNVNKSFENFNINDLSLKIKKGFVTGFIGANGAGKSTVIKFILNLLQPDSGEVSVFGMNHTEHEKDIKERIGFVFDEALLYEELTLHSMKNIIAPSYKQWDNSLFHRYCEQFELPFRQKIKTFSKGMKMKVSLAIALSHGADLLIMDEPTTGLDPMFRREFLELLQDVMLDEEKTVFLSTHIMSDLSSIADYITFIESGEIIFSKSVHDLEEDYAIVRGGIDLLDKDTEQFFLSINKQDSSFEALTSNHHQVKELFQDNVIIEKASLEDIMYYSKGGKSRAPSH